MSDQPDFIVTEPDRHGLDGVATSDNDANATTNGRSRRRRRTARLRVT
jgi:hypothetical protein